MYRVTVVFTDDTRTRLITDTLPKQEGLTITCGYDNKKFIYPLFNVYTIEIEELEDDNE